MSNLTLMPYNRNDPVFENEVVAHVFVEKTYEGSSRTPEGRNCVCRVRINPTTIAAGYRKPDFPGDNIGGGEASDPEGAGKAAALFIFCKFEEINFPYMLVLDFVNPLPERSPFQTAVAEMSGTKVKQVPLTPEEQEQFRRGFFERLEEYRKYAAKTDVPNRHLVKRIKGAEATSL